MSKLLGVLLKTDLTELNVKIEKKQKIANEVYGQWYANLRIKYTEEVFKELGFFKRRKLKKYTESFDNRDYKGYLKLTPKDTENIYKIIKDTTPYKYLSEEMDQCKGTICWLIANEVSIPREVEKFMIERADLLRQRDVYVGCVMYKEGKLKKEEFYKYLYSLNDFTKSMVLGEHGIRPIHLIEEYERELEYNKVKF